MTDEDSARLKLALPALLAHHPGASARIHPGFGEVMVGAADEAALDAVIGALTGALGAGFTLRPPEVAYRETIRRRVEIDETYRHVIGPKGEFARVRILFEPGPRGSGFDIAPSRAGAAVPQACLAAVEKGLEAAREDGLLAGYPVTDLRATLLDGLCHEADSSPRSFAIAARRAFRRLLDEGEPVLLEPLVRVDLLVPTDCAEEVVVDLNKRRARELEQQARGLEVAITALAPLATLFGYRNILRSLSQGRARRRQRFAHYAEAPGAAESAEGLSRTMAMRA